MRGRVGRRWFWNQEKNVDFGWESKGVSIDVNDLIDTHSHINLPCPIKAPPTMLSLHEMSLSNKKHPPLPPPPTPMTITPKY